MARFVFVTIVLFYSLSASALQVDSLSTLLPSLNGQYKVDLLNKLAEKDEKNQKVYANEALELAENIDYPKGQAKATEILGNYAIENKDFENALTFYKKANESYAFLEDTEGQLRTLKGLNNASFDLKNFDDVIDYCLQIQHLAETVDNKSFLAYSYARMGRLRGEIMNDLSGSQEYSLKAIDLYLEIGEKDMLPALYSNLGIAYYLEQQHDSALIYYNKGIALGEKLNKKEALHILYSLSCELYTERKEYDKALEYSKLALSISLDDERKDLAAFDNLLIGQLYSEKEQYDSALYYINIGVDIAKELDKKFYVALGYERLSQIYKGKNNPEKAIEYLEKLVSLKDTIAKSTFSVSLAEKEAEFQIQRKQEELKSLEKSAFQQRLFRNGIILISALVIFILGLFINRYNVIMKFQKQELDRLRTIKQLEEKEKLLLKDKLLHKEKILASNTMHIIQKNKILSDLKSEITNLPAANNGDNLKTKIKSINRVIETNMTFEDDWQNFKLQFEQVHPKFFKRLDRQFPNLGNNETRFCSYIKMGHNTKEIAQLMGINAESVQKARYRLKKKMDLDKSINLVDYIEKF